MSARMRDAGEPPHDLIPALDGRGACARRMRDPGNAAVHRSVAAVKAAEAAQ
jgi:hypothetical protein